LNVRCLFFHGIVLALLILALTLPPSVFAAKTMFMQATLNPIQTDQGVSVTIIGRVFNASDVSVPNAIISIQVNDPQTTSIHLAVAYTRQDGSFSDSFLISPKAIGGNYSIFLVADKPGYDSARVTLTLIYLSPDFSLQSSTSTIPLHQGDTANFTVTVLSLRNFKQPVNITALNLPTGVTAHFNPTSVIASGNITVTLTASQSAALGNFTITLLGVSPSRTHSIGIQLTIGRGPLQTYYTIVAIGVVLLLICGLLLQRRNRRVRRLAAAEAMLRLGSADKGYVTAAAAIARLEELRANSQIDSATYEKLKREYERRLERSK